MRESEIERLETEIRAIREVLVLAEEQEEHPGSPPHPNREKSVELILQQNNLQHLQYVDNDVLRQDLERLERDLKHAQEGWSE